MGNKLTFMKAKLSTVNLEVADPQASKRFYMDVLGLVEDTRRSHAPGFVYLRGDGCDITLAAPEHGCASAPTRSIELGFEASDLEGVGRNLAEAGRPVVKQSMGWGSAVETQDLDGHRVIIYRLKAE